MSKRAIWLRREGVGIGARVVVLVEYERGKWAPVITERIDGEFSHIVEPSGIESAIEKARAQGERAYDDCNCDYDAVNDWHRPECAHLISVAERVVQRAAEIAETSPTECAGCRALLLTVQRESQWVNERNGALSFLHGVLCEIVKAKTVEDARTFAEMAIANMAEFHAGTWKPGAVDDAADWKAKP